MLKPLEEWYCDVCGDVIQKIDEGYVFFKYDENHLAYDFIVAHQCKCDRDKSTASLPLNQFLGARGVNTLLSFLSLGPIKFHLGQERGSGVKDIDEFVDLFRRMQVPYYEEARTKFSNKQILDNFHDATEAYTYQGDVLKEIVEEYDE
jgi:hypothetical protein